MRNTAGKWLKEVMRGDEDSVYRTEQHRALPTPRLPDTGTPLENLNVFREELPACLAICIELGNREGDPTEGIQSLLLTSNSKHKAYMQTQ